MSAITDDYQAKLINKILFACSQEEVKRFIDVAVRTFEQNTGEDYHLSQFIDAVILDLELFSPMRKEAQQWSNIKLARILFNRIKTQQVIPLN